MNDIYETNHEWMMQLRERIRNENKKQKEDKDDNLFNRRSLSVCEVGNSGRRVIKSTRGL